MIVSFGRDSEFALTFRERVLYIAGSPLQRLFP